LRVESEKMKRGNGAKRGDDLDDGKWSGEDDE